MRHIINISALVILLFATSLTGSAAGIPQEIDTESAHSPDRLEIFASNGSIFVTTNKDITIKVYTILGNLVIEKNIPTGTTQIPLKSRGIYLVNVGEKIQRVTL